MDSRLRKRVLEILETVLAAPPEQRNEILADRCAGNPVLLDAVRTRLNADSDDLDEPLVDQMTSAIQLPAGYRLVKELGRGGMGAVYLVDQEERVKRRVALKIIQRGMNRARFDVERQILASLNHAHIAKLFDSGETPDGLPYFIMEYIDGMPINKYIQHHQLSVPQILALFKKVCLAVDYAHRSMIIHRDIKPGNILVGADGEPKLLDFGIAKLLDDPAGITATQARPMTPEYAAPEQLKGELITSSTDVYALGVLLYELLAGTRPYHFQSRNFVEMVRVVCDYEPVKPSRVLQQLSKSETHSTGGSGSRKPARMVEGDLDTIVLTALNKEPEQRYSSASRLADDLAAFMQNEPIRARPTTWYYRTSKFVRRNPQLVSAGVLVVVLVLVFLLVVTKQRRDIQRERDLAQVERIRAERERDIARKERDTAKAMTAYMSSLFEGQKPTAAQGRAHTAKEILDRGLANLSSRLSDQPGVQADIYLTLGHIYMSRGLYDNAKVSIDKGLALKEQLNLEDGKYAFGLFLLGDLLFRTNQSDLARTHFKNALVLCRRLGDIPETLSRVLGAYGFLVGLGGDLEGSLDMLEEAVAVSERAGLSETKSHSGNLLKYAMILKNSGQMGKSLALSQRALEIRQKLFDENSVEVSECLYLLGGVALQMSELEEAADYFRRSSAVNAHLVGAEHADTLTDKALLAKTLAFQGRYDEAQRLLDELRPLADKQEAPLPKVSVLKGQYAVDLSLRHMQQAKRTAGELLEMYVNLLGDSALSTLGVKNLYADMLLRTNHFKQAAAMSAQVLDALDTHTGDQAVLRSHALATRGWALHMSGDSQGLMHLRAGLEQFQKWEGEGCLSAVTAQFRLAQIIAADGDFSRAQALAARAEKRIRRVLGDKHRETLNGVNKRAAVLLQAGLAVEALPLLEKNARALNSQFPKRDHPYLLEAESLMGMCLVTLGRPGGEAVMLNAYEGLKGLAFRSEIEEKAAILRLVQHYQNAGDQSKTDQFRRFLRREDRAGN